MTKDLKEVIDFIVTLIEQLEEVLEDQEISATDMYAIVKLIPLINKAVKGAENIPAEIAAMTDEKLNELKEYIKDELDLTNQEIEDRIEDFIEIIFEILTEYHINSKL